MIDSSSLSAH